MFFVPLLFLGRCGRRVHEISADFYSPPTVLLTLTASLAMALIFHSPSPAALIGRRRVQSATAQAQLHAAETGDPRAMRGIRGILHPPARTRHPAAPGLTLLLAMALLLGSFAAYGKLGAGVPPSFPKSSRISPQVQVRARDDLSVHERDALVRRVEERLIVMEEIDSVIARSFADSREDPELIGTIQLELIDWDARRPAAEIAQEIREMTSDFPGIALQGSPAIHGARNRQAGPARNGAPPMRSCAPRRWRPCGRRMKRLGGFTDVTDTLPAARDRVAHQCQPLREAARFGADVSLLGQAVQLPTQGVTIADFRPESVMTRSISACASHPATARWRRFRVLRVPTQTGLIPITNFVSFEPAPRTGRDPAAGPSAAWSPSNSMWRRGLLVDERIRALRAALEEADLPEAVAWVLLPARRRTRRKAQEFLVGAFAAAIALMFLILITQFNSFRQAVIGDERHHLSRSRGVLIGLIITGRPFGIVMGGIGIIALAGIVVNNNIVLIDTYKRPAWRGGRRARRDLRTAPAPCVRSCSPRWTHGARPAADGCLGMNIDFFRRVMVFGAPSTQWWVELSSAIVGGLLVATVLTLLLTPAMLMLAHGR